MRRIATLLFLLAPACAATTANDESQAESELGTAARDWPVNLAAGSTVLYEMQVRAANACRVDVGSAEQRAACAAKAAPKVQYRAEGMSCGDARNLEEIKLGTLDDMLDGTADYKKGITLRYIRERVGANMVWLMPLFPNNDRWNIPDACDNLGSPYAVRDYFHASGMLSRACIATGRDEHDAEPCWGNEALDAVIASAHQRGLKIMLDVALNHFGHNYDAYDYGDYQTLPSLLDKLGGDAPRLWNHDATFDIGLIHPKLLDSPASLAELETNPRTKADVEAVKLKCPAARGDALVRAVVAHRLAFPHERANLGCAGEALESQIPSFYMGRDRFNPATSVGDTFTNEWRDVKFLFHREENVAKSWEFARQREYLFRILNYWVSRGVDGFRLDHTTDPDSGMGSNEWKYILGKVNYYAAKRGQPAPIYLAEEFHDQSEMNKIVDVMTEGYIGDMTGRNVASKDARHVERVIDSATRFGDGAFTMTALETHDEHRLTDGTGFNPWTGAGFWGVGATLRSTPMIVMGQEFGEPWGIGFRRSDFLRSRFEGSAQFRPDGDALVGFYGRMAAQRQAPENRALLSPKRFFLRPRSAPGAADARVLAMAKWTADGNVVFVFHNLWEQNVEQSFFLPPTLVRELSISDDAFYRLTDAISGRTVSGCRRGRDLAFDFFVKMDAGTRAQWLRLELDTECR